MKRLGTILIALGSLSLFANENFQLCEITTKTSIQKGRDVSLYSSAAQMICPNGDMWTKSKLEDERSEFVNERPYPGKIKARQGLLVSKLAEQHRLKIVNCNRSSVTEQNTAGELHCFVIPDQTNK